MVEAQAIDKQVAEIIITAEHESAVAAGWREIFKSGELQNGRRVLLGGFSQFMQQFGGINLCVPVLPFPFSTNFRLIHRNPRLAYCSSRRRCPPATMLTVPSRRAHYFRDLSGTKHKALSDFVWSWSDVLLVGIDGTSPLHFRCSRGRS